MKINVKYFGGIAEIIGVTSESIEIEVNEKINLIGFFEQKHPKIKGKTYKIVKNQVFCEFLNPEDSNVEIALLPPFAGG